MIGLYSPLTELPRIGKTNSSLLKKLGLGTARDLLFYFPFRYDDFTASCPISGLQAGQDANVVGIVDLIQNKRSRQRLNITEALISDESGSLKIIWFNQPFLTRSLAIGDRISLAGRVSESYGQLAMVSPQYEKIGPDGLLHTSGLIPNYRLTTGLTQKLVRASVRAIIDLAAKEPEWLPEVTRQKFGLISLSEALRLVQAPKNFEDIAAARRRIGFGELFLRQLKSQIIKRELKNRLAPAIPFAEAATKDFVSSLPFKITEDQRQAAWEIIQDLEKGQPMSRLLEGEVGSGKTLVAAIALLNTALSGQQGLLMAPTEILAQQHFRTISDLLKKYDVRIALLTHNYQAGPKEATEADIIIGTQALIQEKISFPRLAFTIVDEQHRFGVAQRRQILSRGRGQVGELTPHFLSLTATPIPRSLALAIYGDLDLSLIKQLPAGRRPIITEIVSEARREKAYDFIRTQIKAGRQAFVICPLIDESDRLSFKSAKKERDRLAQEIFPDLNVGLLHGKLKSAEKEKIMADFLANKIQILVATTIVEVGVDAPNATLMVIEGADRFGLAQLYQFRGRVGRGEHQSYCLLFPATNNYEDTKASARLQALVSCRDGLALARADLKLRGAGEIYGTSQSGFPEMAFASLFDSETIKKASAEAAALIDTDPEFIRQPLLKEKLDEWRQAKEDEEPIHLE